VCYESTFAHTNTSTPLDGKKGIGLKNGSPRKEMTASVAFAGVIDVTRGNKNGCFDCR
jgi:hypothetical protein